MARRNLGDISTAAAGSSALAVLGGGLGIMSAFFVFATASPTKTSLLIRSGINVALGVFGGMMIPGSFGHGFAAGLGGTGALGMVAVAVAPERLPDFAGFGKSLRGASAGYRGATSGVSGGRSRTLAGTMLR